MAEAPVNQWKLRREALNLTQTQVAKMVGVPRGPYALFEAGRRDLGAKFIESLENVLSALESPPKKKPAPKAAKAKPAPSKPKPRPKTISPKEAQRRAGVEKALTKTFGAKVVKTAIQRGEREAATSIEASIADAIADGVAMVQDAERKKILAGLDRALSF